MHGGMSYRRLEEMGGIQWPCYDESHPGEMFLHGRLWSDPLIGPRAPFSVVEFEPPVDALDAEYPIRLTTGRRLDDYNTGVQTGNIRIAAAPQGSARSFAGRRPALQSARRRKSARDFAARLRGCAGTFDPALRPGLAFMTMHSHDQVATNDLTIDAVDPQSGTSEFKATAIRIEKCRED